MKVHVQNINSFPFKQLIGEKEYYFKPGETKEMDRDDAQRLLKRFHKMEFDAEGIQKPESYKALKCDDMFSVMNPDTNLLVCQACGFKATSHKELLEHINTAHLDQMEDQKLADKIRKGKVNEKSTS